VSIFECRRPGSVPVPVDILERHPLGSQAFIPLAEAVMCVVVAPPGDQLRTEDLRAFVTNGRQGVNYRPGTWHMPLVVFRAGQRFVVVDRGGPGDNCEEHELKPSLEVVVDSRALHAAGVDV
jgi:ureidoglycolate lyase